MAGPVSFGYQVAQGGAKGPIEFTVEYLVIAGGGSGGDGTAGGGGGAGGYRSSIGSESSGGGGSRIALQSRGSRPRP